MAQDWILGPTFLDLRGLVYCICIRPLGPSRDAGIKVFIHHIMVQAAPVP